MEYARHESEMRRVVATDGDTQREHLRKNAEWHARKRGDFSRMKDLEGPPLPEALSYLWGWANELHGRSGVGMAGLLPLTYSTIKHWQDVTGNTPLPHEVEALMILDAVLLSPPRKGDKS